MKNSKAYRFTYILITILLLYSFTYSHAQNLDSIYNTINTKNDTSAIHNAIRTILVPSLIGSGIADSVATLLWEISIYKKDTKGLALLSRYYGVNAFNKGDFNKAVKHHLTSISYFTRMKDSSNLAISNQLIGTVYFNMGKPDSAIYYCKEAIKINEKRNDKTRLAVTYNTLGGIYWSKGDYINASEMFFQSLKIKELLRDSVGMANTYNNIGILYDSQQKLPEALEMYQKSLAIYQKKGIKKGIGRAYNNIAIVYKTQNKYNEAIEMLSKSLQIDLESGNLDDQGKTLNNIGEIYLQINELSKSENYFSKALEIFSKNGNDNGRTASIINLGRVNLLNSNYEKANSFFNNSLTIAKRIKSTEWLRDSYKGLYESHKKQKKYDQALKYYELFNQMDDSLINKENLNKLDELRIGYETEIKEQKINLLNKENKLQTLEISRQRTTNMYLLILVAILFSSALAIGFILIKIKKINLNLIHKNTEINQQKEEIESQRDLLESLNIEMVEQKEEIQSQSDKIESQNKIISATNRRITEGIEYASRMQKDLLPQESIIDKYFNDHFIIYLPKDIVSGDFYWLWESKDHIYFSSVDCTGHGVAGAFMSLLAYNLLKDSVHTHNEIDPSGIVSFICNEVENNLYKNTTRHDVKDGMDIAVFKYNPANLILEYSGAHSSFIHIRGKMVSHIKTERYSIGSKVGQAIHFSNKIIQLERGDRLILYTDGIIDQMDEKRQKKVGRTAFMELITNLSELPLASQKKRIEEFYREWKGGSEQIDDILIWGLEI